MVQSSEQVIVQCRYNSSGKTKKMEVKVQNQTTRITHDRESYCLSKKLFLAYFLVCFGYQKQKLRIYNTNIFKFATLVSTRLNLHYQHWPCSFQSSGCALHLERYSGLRARVIVYERLSSLQLAGLPPRPHNFLVLLSLHVNHGCRKLR